jgi:two-component system, chemotaxis family, response regulator Rcp1
MNKTMRILLVEDNPADVRLTQEALKEWHAPVNLDVAKDGIHAISFLRRESPFESALRPDLILLDLNLPLRDGREVLREIKTNPDLKQIPVVVLTTSKAEDDVFKSYDLHANCYITKPVEFEDFIRVVRAIERFWLSTARLPERG